MGIQNPQNINLSLSKNINKVLDSGYTEIPPSLQYPSGYFATTVMPLELIRPAPVSAVIGFYSPDYYGYVGRETQIRITAQGGAYPYAVVIDEAPAGATISNNPNDKQNYLVLKFTPTANGTYPIRLRLHDMEGKVINIRYTFTVSTNWCVFADPVNGVDSPGNGSFLSPFKSIHYARNNTTGGKTLILKDGTYTDTLLGITLSSSNINSIVAFNQRQAIIDLAGNVETTPNTLFYVSSSHVMAQGIEIRNPQNQVDAPRLFSSSSSTSYVYQDNCKMAINGRQGTINGDNVSCFFFGQGPRHHIAQTRCEITGSAGLGNGWSAIDIYAVNYCKIECNTYRDQFSSTSTAGFIWVKGNDNNGIDITNNSFETPFGGSIVDVYLANTIDTNNVTGNVDVSFNLIKATDKAGIWIARSDQTGARLPVWSRRNTVVNGLIVIFKRSYTLTFSSDADVIQSSLSSSDPHKVLMIDQNDPQGVYRPLSHMPTLTASVTRYECHGNSGIVDSNGILIGVYAPYRGTRGHEIIKP